MCECDRLVTTPDLVQAAPLEKVLLVAHAGLFTLQLRFPAGKPEITSYKHHDAPAAARK